MSKVNHRAAYWRSRAYSTQVDSADKKKALRQEIEELKTKMLSADLDNAQLRDEMDEILKSDEIVTFEHGKYTDNVRACIYELLSLNVGVRNVAPIIRCVLGNIVHKDVERLPSHSLTCQMIVESLAIAQAQLGEKLSDVGSFNTIQTDGTTKFGDHFITYDIATPQTSYMLGLRHVFSGSAQNTLETFKEILDDLDAVQEALGRHAVSAKIVQALKNTMSDRHSAQKLFNEILTDYHSSILPSIMEG